MASGRDRKLSSAFEQNPSQRCNESDLAKGESNAKAFGAKDCRHGGSGDQGNQRYEDVLQH